jgi:hypothetical protein
MIAPRAGRDKGRGRMRIAGLAIAFAVGVAAGAALAGDQIKAGKWEFNVTVQVPNMPKLPPGVQLPPGVHVGAGGIATSHTSCLTESDPIPPDAKMPRGGERNGQCGVEKMERKGGTVSWATECTTPQGTIRSEGTAHCDGDRMEATFESRTAQGGAPSETSEHVTGHGLGPC